jgi:hypothetical protein
MPLTLNETIANARGGRRPASTALASAPPAIWIVLAGLTALEAAHEVLGIGGPDALFSDWIHGGVLVAAAILCLARGHYEPRDRAVSLTFGTGLACWAAGEVTWSVLHGGDPEPPYPTVSDALWLAWYPFTAAGFALLIRRHVQRFALDRWMDGVAVMLIALTPCAALLLAPAAEASHQGTFAAVVNFSYPVLDALLVGAVLGVCGLMAWRPGRTWILLGLGCAVMAVSDGLFSVQEARDAVAVGGYDFTWPAGTLLIAYAVWQSVSLPGVRPEPAGWRAIALPLAAQVIAAGIQVYGLFAELGRIERVVTLIVLVVAMVQIVVSRPRGAAPEG